MVFARGVLGSSALSKLLVLHLRILSPLFLHTDLLSWIHTHNLGLKDTFQSAVFEIPKRPVPEDQSLLQTHYTCFSSYYLIFMHRNLEDHGAESNF